MEIDIFPVPSAKGVYRYIGTSVFYFASTKISEIFNMAKCWATYCCPVS